MRQHPTGEVTFLFTDIEGSTRLWELNSEGMSGAIARHDELLRKAIEENGGRVFKTVGDAFCAVFSSANEAISASIAGQTALSNSFPQNDPFELRVRMALHTGSAEERGGDYFGRPLNRVARLLSTAHGGQIILSSAACGALSGPLPADVSLQDLGHHRLKDLLEPEAVHQVCHPALSRDFPPLLSLRAFRHNLPLHVTSFVGRDAEMAAVRELLSRAHLVTLTGSGGTGKTRLSQQVAAEMIDRFADGVGFVELAPITEPALIAGAVAACLGVAEEPGRSIADTLIESLKGRELLLVLDNCEHVVEAAAHLAQALLRSCPGTRILATSREPLQVYGEFNYRVPSLDVPALNKRTTAQGAAGFAGVRLFLDRASAISPHFALTDENVVQVCSICRRLDGIPLAIELAAARVRALSVDQIATRLDDRFRLLTGGSRTALPRQQTLRALIDWSWELLTPPERVLLRRLSVFAGGFVLEAAETVCAGEDASHEAEPIEAFDVLDLVTQLVDKSLVQMEEGLFGPRFTLMETIRSYGADRLQQADESPELSERHLAWCQHLAAAAEPQLDGPKTQDWLDRLEMEHDNLRAALGFAGPTEDRLRLASAIHRFWLVRGHLTEGRTWLESALKSATVADNTLLAKGFNRAGVFAWKQGDFAGARPLLVSSFDVCDKLGDRMGAAGALNNLGLVADDSGDSAAARTYYEQAASVYRTLGDMARTGMVLANLGVNLLDQLELDAARETFTEWLDIAEEANDPWCMATALHNLGEVAYRLNDIGQARKLAHTAIEVLTRLRDSTQVAQVLILLAWTEIARDNVEIALALAAASSTLIESEGLYLRPPDAAGFRDLIHAVRARIPESEFDTCWKSCRERSIESAIRMTLNS